LAELSKIVASYGVWRAEISAKPRRAHKFRFPAFVIALREPPSRRKSPKRFQKSETKTPAALIIAGPESPKIQKFPKIQKKSQKTQKFVFCICILWQKIPPVEPSQNGRKTRKFRF
jgi:hypothetical protein